MKNLEFAVLGVVKGLFMLRSMKKIKHYIQYKQKVSGRCAAVFSSDYIEGDEKDANFGCMKPYIGKHIIFESYEPFVQYGFSTLSYDQDWDGELVKGSFEGNDNSWLVCFKGNPIINGVELKLWIIRN